MYLKIPLSSRLGQPTGYQAPFSTGGQYVGERDAAKVLAVLAGPSPYQSYIKAAMATKAAALPPRFLRIISSPKEVPDARLRDRFVRVNDEIVGGTIDRSRGVIYLLELPSAPGYSRLEFALHEIVHLFAHPFMSVIDDATFRANYGTICNAESDVGSFQRTYCAGFGEGATQAITEQIMEAQGISKYSGERPYDRFTPPVFELIRIFSVDRFARAYFAGAVREFTDAMVARWGNDWRNVANFTFAGRKDRALEEIKRLELAFIKRRGPKGDYPNPARFAKYA